MRTKVLDGVVGWDFNARSIREFLGDKDDDVVFQIASPGGYVTDALEIFNVIKQYRGKKTFHYMGFVGSAATYIAMAADEIIVEDNAVFMVHNPWSIALGDHRALSKEADLLESFTSLLAKAYIEKTGKTEKEVRDWMDAETYFFGSEIVDAGFAGQVELAGEGPANKDDAIVYAKARLENCRVAMQRKSFGQSANNADPEQSRAVATSVDNNLLPSVSGELTNQIGERENMEDGKIPNASTYEQGKDEGVKAERKRVASLLAYCEADPENGKLKMVVDRAIVEGKTVEDVNPQLQVAIRDGGKAQTENAPAVATSQASIVVLDDEAKKIADAFGVSPEAMAKHMQALGVN